MDEVKKYKIQGDRVNPYCIVANTNTVAVDINANNTIVFYSLPNFTQKSQVQMNFCPYDLSISTNYFLVLGKDEMVVKPLDGGQDLCRIKPPVGCQFASVCFRNTARGIYAACDKGLKGCVYRYKWDAGKSQYVDKGCVIDDIGWVGHRCLSVTSDGLLPLPEFGNNVKVYSLE